MRNETENAVKQIAKHELIIDAIENIDDTILRLASLIDRVNPSQVQGEPKEVSSGNYASLAEFLVDTDEIIRVKTARLNDYISVLESTLF